jgi:1,4-alpha-glucan branching enzyme
MKLKLLILFFLAPILSFAQITTNPTLPTANNEITITFDATGTELDGYTGDVYAHTGVTIDANKWQNVIGDWGSNSTQPQLTRDSSNSNLYTLVITPDVFTFYGVASTENITEIDLVVRSADGSQQSRPDYFIPLYQEGLNITFTNPENNSVFNLNSTITISAEASINTDLELFVNNSSQNTSTNTTTISTNYTFSSTGLHTIKATAVAGAENKQTEISVYVKTPTQNKTIPTGVKNGVNINNDNSVTFVLFAPEKSDVFLIGDFNNWELNENYQLYKDGEYFWITLTGLDIGTEFAYQYAIDYSIKVADPYSEKILDPWTDQYIKEGNYPNLKAYPENKTTGYVSTFKINQENYTWNVDDFSKPNSKNLVIYELLIRDFTESDSYNEALTKLDYLQSLGINAIHLMPINEFEGADSWGYNPALYLALDKAYGTKNDFKKFVDACHQRGIAVLTDVVFNHSFSQSPLLQMYFDSVNNKPAANNPWYNENHNFVDNTSAQWGYDFNHESTDTETFFKDVLTYWMNEYKIDGFRFDFTKGFSNTIYTGSNNWASAYDADRIAILKNYADHVWNNNPTNKPYVIFEHLSENSEETELANYGIMLWGNMNYNYNQNTMGYSSGADISWISYKNRGWNNPNVVGYMESHDEERLMYRNLLSGRSNGNYNIKNLNTALERQELAGMFFYTIPGPKLLWQFGELGYEVDINLDGRTARKPVRWNYVDNVNRMHLYNTWATLLAFKQQQPVFNTNDFTLNVTNLLKSIILRDATMDVVILGNFDIENKEISIEFTKTGIWYEYFTGKELNITITSQTIQLKSGEYQLYSSVKLLDPRGGTALDDSDNDGVNDSLDLCPNTMEGIDVTETGCPIFSLPSNNFEIEAVGETCPDKENGQILITAAENYNYTTTIDGIEYNFTDSITTLDLAPGTYDFCIEVEGQTYEQCYVIVIESGTEVGGKVSVTSNKASVEIVEGTAPFIVYLNKEEQFKTTSPVFSIDVKHGDLVEVKTAVTCEGVYSKKIELLEGIVAYPNPSKGSFEISLPVSQKEVIIELYTVHSQLIWVKTYPILYGRVQLQLEDQPRGLYIAKVHLDQPVILKIIKQ